jgi:hypothetical protein
MSRARKDINDLTVPELWRRMETVRAKIAEFQNELAELDAEFKAKTNQQPT